jgi:HEAT repeat protein
MHHSFKPEKKQYLLSPTHKTLFRAFTFFFILSTLSLAVHGQNPVQQAPQAGQQSVSTSGDEEMDGALATVASGTGLLVVVSVLMVGLLVTRRVRPSSRSDLNHNSNGKNVSVSEREGTASRSTKSTSAEAAARQPVKAASSPYSAYRIDQEVRKRVLGSPYGAAVLFSRVPEDRRAIETSLLRSVTFSETDDERRRSREALEQYGFVARHCATLLAATNAFDRTSAARTLGEIGATSALPFLLEALHDVDSTVRNQVVMSIGELKLSSSMGVLLDVARKHPGIPDNILSRALSASSPSGLASFDGQAQWSASEAGSVFDIKQLEPVSPVEDLLETSEEESFEQVLIRLESSEQADRVEAAKALAHFRVKKSVALLTGISRTDPDSFLKATAINSLGFIDHPSVFPAILIAMADESRMVQAAAARALGWLSFDRSEQYVRLLQTADEQTLKDVAEACIEAGIVEHHIDRLANSNRYQAYETFALICLLAKAQRSAVMLDKLTSHSNLEIGLSMIHLLSMTGQPELLAQLEQLADRKDVPDELKAALRGCRNKSAQSKSKPEALAGEESGSERTESSKEKKIKSGRRKKGEKPADSPIDSVESEQASVLLAGDSAFSAESLNKLDSKSTGERAATLNDLAQTGGEDAFQLINCAFDDESPDVRNAAARALYDFSNDRVASFTRALCEGSPERRRRIGAALVGSGLAGDAIANLTSESGEKTYDAFSLLFLMAKAGEIQPLLRAIENYPSAEIRQAVVNLLALSGQPDSIPALTRLAVRGSQPPDVKSALMEAIYRIDTNRIREVTPTAPRNQTN